LAFTLVTVNVLMALAASAAAAEKPAVSEAQKRACFLIKACALAEPAGLCPPEAVGRSASLEPARCQDARDLAARGLVANSDLGFRVFSFLGYKHQVVYLVEGELTLSRARLDFLLNDLPLAAKLLSAFQKNRYAAEYLDPAHTRFKGNRGDDLRGEAEHVTGSTSEGRLVYLGTGSSQLGFWKLKGRGLVQVSYLSTGPDGRRLSYKIRVVASPVNAVINAFMQMGVFKSLVQKRIRDIITDIAEAAQKFERGGLAGIKDDKAWTGEEKQKLEALLQLP